MIKKCLLLLFLFITSSFSLIDEGMCYDERNDYYYMAPCKDSELAFFMYGVIYDTDRNFNNLLKQNLQCDGAHLGIVEDSLDSKYKLVYTGSENAVKCFGSRDLFKTLFNYTDGVNEVQCLQMAMNFENGLSDSLWRFGDNSIGFFPVDSSSDSSVLSVNFYRSRGGVVVIDSSITMGPLPGARTKYDFSGELHNSQFCMEMHNMFKYRKGDSLVVSSSGDTWVFVNRKLVLDLGGRNLDTLAKLHLANLNEKFGENFLKEDEVFTFDIYSCSIGSKNMFSMAGNLLLPERYYTKGSSKCERIVPFCEEVLNGWMYREVCSMNVGNVEYKLYSEKNGKIDMKTLENGKVNYGGIDLTNPTNPKLLLSEIQGLENGDYRLYVFVEGQKNESGILVSSFSIGPNSLMSHINHEKITISLIGLNLRVLTPLKKTSYKLFDLQGRVLLNDYTNKTELFIRLPHKGVYLLSVDNRMERIIAR